ncbi:MAG: deoxynucleoside kinase [Candidatus Micrarchaeota archaeon]
MYISVSGVHGSGKTNLCRMLARRNGWEYSPEIVDTIIPPPSFGPKSKNRLLSQLWHLRQLVLREDWLHKHQKKVVVTDRWWQDLIVYSKVLLSAREYMVIESIISAVQKEAPDLEIILWAPNDEVLEKISAHAKEKGGSEADNDLRYLKNLNHEFKKYHDAFKELRTLALIEATGSSEDMYRTARGIISRYVVDKKQRTLGEFHP